MPIQRSGLAAGWLVGSILILAALGCTREKELTMPGANAGGQPFTNRLIHENSAYLLSHAHNPVDWYPWGPEALHKAVSENKPIFLSIGYAACHWCHVMERESFEDRQTAALLNEHFISIKVDREQRPDLDQIYMAFTMAMTGQGGWPMSVFLTPDRKPFFAGTYFPPEDRMGRPGFRRVITEIARSYRANGESIVASADSIFNQVSLRLQGDFGRAVLSPEMISRSAEELLDQSDEVHGGFGDAPKFPHSLELSLLLRQYRKTGDLRFLQTTQKALDGMARGGIYDHLAGGFARYSVDQKWLVPHFEKMLYDNALLVTVYAEAFQVTGRDTYLTTIRETLDFLLREMADKTGGFYSALDADSEGEEGKFYMWRKDEIDSLLGHDADLFSEYYNVTEAGNFEGRNILNLDAGSERLRQESGPDDLDARLARARKALLAARSKRIRPLTDDKILTSWNGLALSAFCRGYQVTGDSRYLEAALKNAAFVRNELFRHGKLAHSYREGKQSTGEFLEDYAAYIRGLIDLYESDHSADNLRWLDFACELADQALALFVDSAGRFYLRPDNQMDLILRPKDETDGSTPAPGSIMISNLLRLNRLTGQKQYLDAAEGGLRAISGALARYRGGMTSALLALDDYYGDKVDIVLIGEGPERTVMLQDIYRRFLPNRIVAMHPTGRSPLPLFKGRTISDSGVSAYLCINSACKLPAATADELRRQLDAL